MNELRENRHELSLNWRDVLAICMLVGIIMVYFRPLIWTDKIIYGELDIRRSLYLFKKVAYDTMRAGEAPLWMPYLYSGMPLLASFLVTPFYPVDLVLFLMQVPLSTAFNWDLLIHLIAAQVFSFMFFKRLHRSLTAAVFGSMWFWNIFFLGSIATGDALNVRAMLLLPAVFYFVEAGMSDDGRSRHFLFGSLAVSMQMLCGGLQITFYTIAAATAYSAFLLTARAKRKEKCLGRASGYAAMVVLAIAIASVHLAPAWEYSRLSVRATGIPWFRIWALKPHQVLEYLVPMFEGEGHGYFGITAIALAAYSMTFWKDSRKYFFAVLGVIAVLYSFGGNTRVSSLLAGLPLVRGFRGPFRGSILFNLSVFVLAGGFLAGHCGSNSSPRPGNRIIASAVVSALLLGGFAVAALIVRSYPGTPSASAEISAIFLALSIAGALVSLLSDRLRVAAKLGLVALLAGDLALNYAGYYSPSKTDELFAEDWTVDLLKKETATARIEVHNTAHSNYFGLFGIEAANGHHPFPTERYARFLPLLKNPKIASLAGVAQTVYYHIGKNGLPIDPPVRGLSDVTIVSAPIAPLSRAFLVGQYRVVPTAQVLDTMREGGFNPAQEVILEQEPGFLIAREPVLDPWKAVITSRESNRVVVDTECNYGAILVLCDSYYPGWRAEVDGAKAEILKADYVFRAVPLPRGNHKIVFSFRPPIFFAGVLISWVGTAFWLAWAFVVWRNKAL